MSELQQHHPPDSSQDVIGSRLAVCLELHLQWSFNVAGWPLRLAQHILRRLLQI